MEKAKKEKLNEDWLAFWLAIILIVFSLIAYLGIDPLGWSVKTEEWVNLKDSLKPLGKAYQNLNPILSLLLTYLFLNLFFGIGVTLLGINFWKFSVGFFFIFWLSYFCWFVGHYAYFAATDPAKYNISWALKLTGEGGYIFALILGLILGNFFKSFSNLIKDATLPEFYVKTAIGLMGAVLGLKSASALGLASTIFFSGFCAIVVAYLIFWALTYYIARKWFHFSKEWSAPLASGISICGVSAAIATGGAIKARPVVPIMVSSLVVIFAVIELVILPFLAQHFLWKEPMVAGAWMGLTVKTDGAAFAAGAIVDALIRGKAEAEAGIKYEPGWIMMTAATTKLFIDVFISVWAFILAYVWCAYIERKPGEKVSGKEIWKRFPKFVLPYAIGFAVFLIISAPHAPRLDLAKHEIKNLEKEITKLEKQLEATPEEYVKSQILQQIQQNKQKITQIKESLKNSENIINKTKVATSGLDNLRKLMFLFTFFTIGIVSNFKKLWEEGIGKLAIVYFLCLFGFIIWIGLIISYIFFAGTKPPVIVD